MKKKGSEEVGNFASMEGERPMKLLFMDRKDIFNTWGKIQFGATPLEKIANHENPDPTLTDEFTVRCCLRRIDGSYTVYACDGGTGHVPWQIYRFDTEDGIHLANKEKVYESKEGKWEQTATVSYSPEKNMLLCLKNANGKYGGVTYAFYSYDGTKWKEYENNPVYYEGDRWGAVWSSALQKFITYNKGIQRFSEKRMLELALNARRVLTIRMSSDGFHWEPDDPSMFQKNSKEIGGSLQVGGPLLPVEYQISPDELDPPDLEFYASMCFEYERRYYLMMLNYAGCFVPPGTPPVGANGHGPQLGTEWWISRDGLNWSRPFRDINATENATNFIQHNPIVIDGKLLFHMLGWKGVWGIPEDRITYVTSWANGIFETLQFPMPGKTLKLNAKIPGDAYPEGHIQAYVMAELIDDCDRVIPGYEREKCLLRPIEDSLSIDLKWKGKNGKELSGHKVRIRFYMRASYLYAVTA